MMKRLLTIAALLLSTIAHAQIFNKSSTSNSWNRVKADSAMYVPLDTFKVRRTAQSSTNSDIVGDSGRIAFKNKRLYYNIDSVWVAVPSIGPTTDTGFIRNQKIIQTADYNITGIGRINTSLGVGSKMSGPVFPTNGSNLFYGDSYVLGIGASPSTNRFSTLTNNLIGGVEVNYGIGSSTVWGGSCLGAVSWQDLLAAIPTKTNNNNIVIFLYGLNDVGCNSPSLDSATYKASYRTAINAYLTKGWDKSNILIVSPSWVTDSAYRKYATLNGGNGVPTRSRHEQFIDATRAVAQEYQIPFINMYDTIRLNGAGAFMDADSLHWNNAGHAKAASVISKYIRTNMPGAGRYQLFTDSAGVTFGNLKTINSKVIIDSTVAAFNTEVAVVPSTYNYTNTSYHGMHLVFNPTDAYLETVGMGSLRARPLILGYNNNGTSVQVAKFDTTGYSYFTKAITGTVSNDGTSALQVGGDIRRTNGTVSTLLSSDASTFGSIGTSSNHALVFSTNNTERARITPTGRMLLGTTTDDGASILQINGDGRANNGAFNSTNGTVSNVLTHTVSTGVVGTASNHSLQFWTNSTARAGMNTLGEWGFGTNSASGIRANFDGTLQSNNGYIVNDGTTITYLSNSPGVLGIVGTSSNHPFTVVTNGTEKVRVAANGNVGIGTTSATSTMHISGSVATAITATATDLTLDVSHRTVRVTAAATITLPAASSCPGREYVIVNYNTGGNITISSFFNKSAVSTTTIPNAQSVVIQSDGTNWYQN